MVAESPAMRRVLVDARAVAGARGSIVLHGETGTGKEVLARAIHAVGPRSAAPFVAVNCGAIPGDLLESELFGHVRGAFSGAFADKPGLFEEARRGTLLLDEVAELPPRLQVKLLRVLQDGEVRRVGATSSAPVDVRVLAATHRDRRAQVAAGLFREDLYYRLKVFTLTLPPLRDRGEDVVPLANHFVSRHAPRSIRIAAPAEAALLAYPWPGNIRELSNAIEHAVAFAGTGPIELEHLPVEVRAPEASGARLDELLPLCEVEHRHILRVLAACRGRHSEAARVLGISRSTLWRRLVEAQTPPAALSPGAAGTASR
jgi:two-component system response regulator HydG